MKGYIINKSKWGKCIIILISAPSSTGKTLMDQRLLEKYHIPYFSINHLKMGLYTGHKQCGFTPLEIRRLLERTLANIKRNYYDK